MQLLSYVSPPKNALLDRLGMAPQTRRATKESHRDPEEAEQWMAPRATPTGSHHHGILRRLRVHSHAHELLAAGGGRRDVDVKLRQLSRDRRGHACVQIDRDVASRERQS